MASVEAGGTRSCGGRRIRPLPRPNPPHRLAGILLREHDEDLDRLAAFQASTADARTASQETVGRRLWHRMPRLAVGLAGAMASAGPLAGIEDQGYQPCGAYFIPGIVYLADAVGTETETLAIRGLSLGVGIGRIARREARSPDCSSAAFSRPRCCPSSAGCGAILHDVDVNTQIEAAVGGAGIVQPFLIRSANHKSVEQLSSAGAPIELSSLTVCEKGL